MTQPQKNVVYFAKTNYRGQDKLFGIKRKDRRQHMYVMGKTGVGKSALLHNLISQDIMNGEGVCVVDPHGELVEGVLDMIPESRKDDVIYFNPADRDFHVGFNPMDLPDPKYKHLVASGLMGIFTKMWANVWSARMEYILNNTILALLDTPGSTMLGIPRMLTDKEYRQKIIDNLKDPVIRAFWVNEFEDWKDKYRNEAIAPVQNKVGQFLATDIVRNVVGQSKSSIDIFKLMNEGKIFLVNVSKGRIGEDNSALLGAMLITKIQLSAMERVRIPEDERRDFYLYVDEFQNFATDSFAGVLSEARKYRLNLIIAHQYIGQLQKDGSDLIRDAVFGNSGTMLIFRVGAKDAEFLENEFDPEFTIQDIVNLPNYHVYLKMMVNGVTCRPFSAITIPPFKKLKDAVGLEGIVNACHDLYARPRKEVEDEINRWSSFGLGEEEEENQASNALKKGEYFETGCSVPFCETIAKLPFKPNPDKPVYCSRHLEQVQAGEIEPIKIIKNASKERMQKASDVLADIGIEFDVKPKGQEGSSKKRKRKKKKHGGEVSLNQLSGADSKKQPRIKESTQAEGIKSALQSALSKSDN